MILDENLTTAAASVTAYASSTNGSGKTDVIDFGSAYNPVNVPKGAKIIVTLTNAMTSGNSNLKLAYGTALSSGDISSPAYSPEVFSGSSTSTDPEYTQKTYVFHLDAIAEKAFRYVQVVMSNAGTANSMTAKLVLETPHNSGAMNGEYSGNMKGINVS